MPPACKLSSMARRRRSWRKPITAPALFRHRRGELQAEAGVACFLCLVQREVVADAAAAQERVEVGVAAKALAVVLLVFVAELGV